MLPILRRSAIIQPALPSLLHESYLSRMNTECLSKINKIGINHSTKTAMEEINTLYQISINEEVKNQYGMLHANQLFLPDDSFTSTELAKGHQISCGLFSSHEFQ